MNNKKVLIIVGTVLLIMLIIALACVGIYFYIKSQFVDNSEMADVVVNTINDNQNQIDKTSTSEKDNTDPIEEGNAYMNSFDCRTIVAADWSRLGNAVPMDYEEIENGVYLYDGYTMYSDNYVFINKIIFNEDFDGAVIGDVEVGDKEDTVIEKLGDPNYISNEVYGYKMNTGYVFFYDDEIVIYPNIDLDNSGLENFIFNYINGKYEGYQTNFVVDVKQKYNDFIAENDGDDVVLISLDRQIIIRLNGVREETQVLIYNGYKMGSLINDALGVSKNIVDLRTEDLVFNVEQERAEIKDND